jgi:hypothetical protein
MYLCRLCSWHPDFELDSCPEVAEEDLPPKPLVHKMTAVGDVIKATNEAFGVNRRLEEALKKLESKKDEKVRMATKLSC